MSISGAITLSELLKLTEPDGGITSVVVNMLARSNDFIFDMPFKPTNDTDSHRMSVYTDMPSAYVKRYNQGIPFSSGKTAQVTEPTISFSAQYALDKHLADTYGDVGALRNAQDVMFAEAMNRKVKTEMIYGSNETELLGLASRYKSLSDVNADNIMDCGGTGSDNTSVYVVLWSDNQCFGTYPKHTQSGLIHEDLGVQRIQDADGNWLSAYAAQWTWRVGLNVPNWRHVVRLANIDVSNLISGTGAVDLMKKLTGAITRLPNASGRRAIYCNRLVKEAFFNQALDKSQNAVTIQEAIKQFGLPEEGQIPYFLGVPLRTVDEIVNTEARVI